MKVRDVITFEQKIFQTVPEEIVQNYFLDDNYMFLLKFLREGPKTIKEIYIAFKGADMEKSEKTIYRYLQALNEVDLVAEAGVRVETDEETNKNKSYTIYTRTAKVFFDNFAEVFADPNEPTLQALCILLGDQFSSKKVPKECVRKVLLEIFNQQRELIVEMFETTSEELKSTMKDLNYYQTNNLLNLASWLSIFKKLDIEAELRKCFIE